MRSIYPNLELIEYIVRLREGVKPNEQIHFEVFSQVWGSTCTAFDNTEDGSPAFGGCAMTEAYTVLAFYRDCCAVFIGNVPCYVVQGPFTEPFLEDVKARNIKSYSDSKKYY